MEQITAQEAARRLGINIRTLWRWRDAGKLKEAGRMGKTVTFYAKDVDALRGVKHEDSLTVEDVYERLSEADSWEDVQQLKDLLEARLRVG